MNVVGQIVGIALVIATAVAVVTVTVVAVLRKWRRRRTDRAELARDVAEVKRRAAQRCRGGQGTGRGC